jgi:hypothetical protein
VISEKEALDAIPKGSFLDDYVRYALACTDANVAYHIIGGLIALAQTVPNDLGLPLGDGKLFANLYGLVVGPSTESRKSVAITICKRLLMDANVGIVAETPGSHEGLSEGLRANPKQLIVYPEFGSFLANTEKGYQVPIKTTLTDAYDGSDLGRALAKSRRGVIKSPRLSILGGSTIDFLERHTEPADWMGGFLARFFTIYADRERTFRKQPHAVPGRAGLIERLQLLNGVETFGGPCLGFHPSVDDLWDGWYDDTEQRMKNSARETRASIARSHSMAMKIALILAWDYGAARSGEDWYVTEAELAPAIRLTEFHIKSVLELGDRLAPSKVLRDRLAILHSIGKRPTSTGTIITKSKLGLKKYVQDLLYTLEEERVIRRIETADGRNDCWVKCDDVEPEVHDSMIEVASSTPDDSDVDEPEYDAVTFVPEVIGNAPPELET